MHRHRTIFISDLHLGSRLCKAENVLDFLRRNEAETIYLVGDLFDIKRLRKRVYWPASHGAVVRELLAKARRGTRIVYIPGNHDPELKSRPGERSLLAGITVQREAIHVTARGERLLVAHGDEHEPARRGRLGPVFAVGCLAYLAGVRASEVVGHLRQRLGLGWWSLSAALKDRFLHRVEIARRYKRNLVQDAKARGLDGVVAGHIHHAAVERIDDITYYNDGDWVESCTALVEDHDGELHLLRWSGRAAAQASRVAAPRRAGVRPVPVENAS